MKRFNTLLLLFFSLGLFAQDAPDFTVTDTHGVDHTLYEDYLDQGMTVVLDLFYVDCPPCNTLAPLLEPLYQAWGAGTADVQFISLTREPNDDDATVLAFEELHGTTWPAISADGGGPAALQPYTTGTWGTLIGYPTLIVISPDRSVQFDAWVSGDYPATIELLDDWITNTGATKPVSSIEDLENVGSFSISPNPVVDMINFEIELLQEETAKISVYNKLGQEIKNVYSGNLKAGLNTFSISTNELNSGTYYIKINMKGEQKMAPFVKL